MAEPESPNSGFTRGGRRLTTVNLLAQVLAAAAILVMANYLAAGHFKRFHWNNLTSFKLSPLTTRLLGPLTNDVRFTIFFSPQNQGDVYSMVCGILTESQAANPRHVHVVKVDEERDFVEVKALLERLHLTGSNRRNFVAFESNGQKPVIHSEMDLAHLDASDLAHIRRDAFNGETYFTSDIFNVMFPQPQKAYFLTGHGERGPGEDTSGRQPGAGKDGFATLADILKVEANCECGPLSLQGTNTIPADCRLVIIASPQKEVSKYSSNEIAQIQDYLQNSNGRLLALLDVEMGLTPLLTNWGVILGDRVVKDLDPQFHISGVDGFMAPMHNVPNPIVSAMTNYGLMLHMYAPRPVFKLGAPTNPSPGAPQVEVLAGTSANGTDDVRKGYFPLIAAIEHGVINDRNGTRLVVAGDADFLDDQRIDLTPGANHFFAGQVLNWLLQRPNVVLAELPARRIQEYPVYLTDSQSRKARWLFLAAMPGAVLFLGGLVWLRRRK